MSQEIQEIDVLIVGGGVGGITLAQWLTGLGRSWRIVEQEGELGGALKHSEYPLKWIPALPQISGAQYLAQMKAAIDQQYCYLAQQVQSISLADGFECGLSSGQQIRAKKLVFACGASPYSPFKAAERIIVGPGLARFNAIEPASRVAVLGGGDNALEHALFLHQRHCRVDLYARDQLRASSAFLQQLQATRIQVFTQCPQIELLQQGEKVLLNQQQYDYACVYYGYAPSNILTKFPLLSLPDSGLREGVHLIGDMTNAPFPSVLLTQGQAAQLAKQLDFELG
ncbi:FAD-dependent oxidoreductase [Chitinibacter sp. FCG-7]|uniref:FAD-dependent oxidoreductase n=1 Tax=Chitinibacter mangrovi TaxID=3153927 RepID=A0AAU7F6K0_9NEIS